MKTYREKVLGAITSFSDLYSKYVKFDEKDRNKANRMVFCPFHDNKNTPAMSINVTGSGGSGKGLYFCYSCKAKGDVIEFYKNMFNLDFKEALARLGKDVGVEPSDSDNHGGNGHDKEPRYGDDDFADFISPSGDWSFGGDSGPGVECGPRVQGEKEEGSSGTDVATATETDITTGTEGTETENGGDQLQPDTCTEGSGLREDASGHAEVRQQGKTGSEGQVKKPKHKDLTEEVLEGYHRNLTLDKLKFFESRKISLDVVTKLKIGYKDGHYVWPIRKNGELHTYKFYRPEIGSIKKNRYQLSTEELGYKGSWIFPEPDKSQEIIFLMEGETDTLCAISMGLNACTGTVGAGTFDESILPYFKNKIVYICYDVDDPGKDGAKTAASAISFHAKETRIIDLDLDVKKYPKGDFTDWVVSENHTIKDFKKLMKKSKLQPKDMPDKDDISSSNTDLITTINESWKAISEHNKPEHLFYMGGNAVQVAKDSDGLVRVKNIDQYSMQFELAESANWITYNAKNVRTLTRPPLPVSRAILEDNISVRLPILDRVVHAPVVAKNGKILTTPGYNKEARVYYVDEDLDIPEIPEEPTAEQAADAKSVIMDDLIIDFPFLLDSDRANAIGLLILPFVREMINGPTPNHLIEKPTPGTGASLMADIFSIVSQGKPALTMTEGHDDDEWRKRITSAMMEYPSIVLIDNISRKIDSASLSSAITRVSWEDRILGSSKNVSIPIRCAWVMSGNNPVLSSEMARRTISIRMDAKLARPWQREANNFKHPNLREWVIENREKLIYSILVISKYWISKGKPLPKVKLGGFEAWSNVVGGILQSIGITEHLGNLESFYERADTETELWSLFIDRWHEKFKSEPIVIGQIYEEIKDIPFELGSGDPGSQKTRLGKKVQKILGRRFMIDGNVFVLEKTGAKHKSSLIVLRNVSNEQKKLNLYRQTLVHAPETKGEISTKEVPQQDVAISSENSVETATGGGGGGGGSVSPQRIFKEDQQKCLNIYGLENPPQPPHPPLGQNLSEIGAFVSGEKHPPSPPEDPIVVELRNRLSHLRSVANGKEEVRNYLSMAEDQINKGNFVFADSYLEKAKTLMESKQ